MRTGKTKRIAALLLILLLIAGALCFYARGELYFPAEERVEAMRQRIREQRFIVHAGGFLTTSKGERVNYTNSYEGLLQLWEAGNRVCEFDFRETSDGVLVCAHGNSTEFAEGTGLPPHASSEEFMAAKIYEEFTPMTAADLTAFMREHPELIVVTDVKDDNLAVCRRLAGDYPDLRERFIMQIYHAEEYEPIREMGFPFLIFTLYRTGDAEAAPCRLIRFAHSHELVGFTFRPALLCGRRFRYGISKTGTPYMLHTLNEPGEMGQYLEQKLCLGLYTDLTGFPETGG